MCFACGQENPIGLRIRFRMDGDVCRASFTANENHVGFANTVHGGIIFSALDDVMANVLWLQNMKGHTARCEVRYRRPLEVGQPINLTGWIEQEKRRLVLLKGEARLTENDELVADSTASFMVFGKRL